MSKMFDKIKGYYDKGLWTAEMVQKAVECGRITTGEYNQIVGQESKEVENESTTNT